MMACSCNPSTEKVRNKKFLGFLASSTVDPGFQRETLSQKIQGEELLKNDIQC